MIGIGSDHTALELKGIIKEHLEKCGFLVKDYGTHTPERTDYPIYAEKVALAVKNGECERGILICGSGVGMGIAANKIRGIRCVICSEAYSARMSRKHNDTNMLALGARVVGPDAAKMIVDEWLGTKYEGGRHQRRVDMICSLEQEI